MPTTMTGTQLRCPTCNHTQPPKTSGVVIRLRAAGHEVVRTRFLARCPVCERLRFLISEPAGQEPPAAAFTADREATLQELAAYVGEGTMDIGTAEAVAAATCPEARKRHIAALVAEGVLKPADAVRLLAIR